MPFSSDLDDFLAKLQERIDAAMGEAREELKEMAVEAEKDWAEIRQRFRDGCCEPAKPADTEEPSHSGTSADAETGDQPG
jgi:hypothetical protein